MLKFIVYLIGLSYLVNYNHMIWNQSLKDIHSRFFSNRYFVLPFANNVGRQPDGRKEDFPCTSKENER